MSKQFGLAVLVVASCMSGEAAAFDDIEMFFWSSLSCENQGEMERYITEYPSGLYLEHARQCRDGHVAVESDNMEGWTIDYGSLEFRSDGKLAIPATGGRTSYFISPGDFLGDWTSRDAVALRLNTYGGTYYASEQRYAADADLVISNGALKARHNLNTSHSGQWQEFIIPLRDEDWAVSPASATLHEVLGAVSEFRIRAEYGLGDDHTFISGVRLLDTSDDAQ